MFKAIACDEDIAALVARFALVEGVAENGDGSNVLAVYVGSIAGAPVRVIHRWHDPSQAFAIRPDINKIRLQVSGATLATVEFEDRVP